MGDPGYDRDIPGECAMLHPFMNSPIDLVMFIYVPVPTGRHPIYVIVKEVLRLW
jgi:hypothetical protein